MSTKDKAAPARKLLNQMNETCSMSPIVNELCG